MSRLIVKNLPLSITEAKLRAAFAPHGEVTDLQLKYNKQGKFRGFAFIGFREGGEADRARDWLNDTYIGAAKVRVEQCKDLGAGGEKDNNNEVEKKPVAKEAVPLESGIEKYKDDVKFQEYSRAVKGEDAPTELAEKVKESTVVEEEEEEKVEKVSDLDYLKSKTVVKDKEFVQHFTVKLSGLPYKCKKKDIKEFFGSNLKLKSVRLPPKIKGIAFAGFATEKERKQALVKNKSFMGQSQVLVARSDGRGRGEEGEAAAEGDQSKWREQEAALAGTETIGESGRIFVRNLSYSTTEEDIEQLFAKFGPLTEARCGWVARGIWLG